MQFNEDHLKRLRRNKNLILEHLNIDEIIPDLRNLNVLTEEDKESIERRKAIKRKREKFYDIMLTKNGTQYWKFISLVQNTDQHFISTLLEAPGNLLSETVLKLNILLIQRM